MIIADTIHVDSYDSLNNKAAIGWEVSGNRFHVWIFILSTDPTKWSPECTIYKNCPVHLKHGEPGYFHTRQLDLDKKVNQELWRDIVAYVNANDLVCRAISAHNAEMAMRRAQGEEALRIAVIKNVGFELYEALKEIADGLANTGSVPGQWMTKIRKDDAYRIAVAAIAKAESL